MNPLQHCLSSVEAVAAYQRMRQQLNIDNVIFDAMAQVAHKRSFQFTPPTSTTHNTRKHEEIEGLLGRYQNVLGRQGLFFDLIEEVYLQLQLQGMQALGQHLLQLTTIQSSNEFRIRLTTDSAWVIEWELALDLGGGLGQDKILVIGSVYKNSWGEIIPWDVMQYLRSGFLLFRQKVYATSLALMSIAVEATLRDILATRGYTFTHNANRQNIYNYAKAQVDVNGNSYTLTFIDPVPQSAASLVTSSSGNLPVDIEIRRSENSSKKRVDLVVKCPSFLVEHWSPNNVVQPAVTNNIGGLGEALRIARDVEGIIDPVDLPLDVDEVLKALRNNLIHFSSNSMEAELKRYSAYSSDGRFTLKDFVNNTQMVFDLVTEIPRFVNEQYIKLFQSGIRIP
ncbi:MULTISPECIES: hypothetical protein [Cyanophyceae]|uniref:hypothetical protein n=1 Tax=Cyanophyceae TaxID=3028117 RepID=UPI001683EED6|nr:hypothetical protein [Trichocoleus sp. FACHB-69]MBD1930275.1 hypothetical protein [Trichocoleus sp. FACHB-69]